MAKKSSPVEKAARMLDLVPFIMTHQGIPTKDLATEFGISEDELISDLTALWMCGDNRFDLIDLQFDSGYVTIRNADSLNHIRSLSQQELISLLIGLQLIEKSISADRSDILKDIDELRLKLGKGLTRILDATPSINSEVLKSIHEGIDSKRKISIQYFSPSDDQITLRTISPLEVKSENGHDFLLAFCDTAQAHRTFRVDRIRSTEILDSEVGSIPLPGTEAKLMTESVKILRDKRRSIESLGNFVTGNGDEFEVSTYSPEWLSRTVIAGAGAMMVTSAGETRLHIHDAAQKTLDLYR